MDSAAPDLILQNHHLCSGTVSLVSYSKSKSVLKELLNYHYYSLFGLFCAKLSLSL